MQMKMLVVVKVWKETQEIAILLIVVTPQAKISWVLL